MLYTTLKAGGKEYKLRYTVNSMCQLEKMMGKGVQRLTETGEFTGVRSLLWAGLLTLNSGVTLERAGEIIDEYLEGGGSLQELAETIKDAMKAAGFAPKEEGEPGEQIGPSA